MEAELRALRDDMQVAGLMNFTLLEVEMDAKLSERASERQLEIINSPYSLHREIPPNRYEPPPPTHPPPPGLDYQTPTQVLKQASSIFWSHLITFTFLAFLILTFRSNVENGSHLLSSTATPLSDHPSPASTSPKNLHHLLVHPAPPFLHLTRIATLDGDLLSGDDDDISRRSMEPSVSEIVRTGFSVKLTEESNTSDEVNEVENSIRESERVVDLQFLIKGWGLPRRDAWALFFLVGLLPTAYGHRSWIGTIWDGSILGSKRVSGFILMRWAVRDALKQFLGLWFFGELHYQYSFFKVFLRLKLMPFSIMSPWIRGFEEEKRGVYVCVVSDGPDCGICFRGGLLGCYCGRKEKWERDCEGRVLPVINYV
ncbi:hypothetical protein Acr_15g0009680 [Actinidia rufa]|uniref:Transmembrane protein n=1 Tax=Actinidia rufa TaxID=165716 RepID=A0A7J0FW10_9ERIC|nr:hypothetical protein Acr_15g0009680 [Actinidia rufa]